MNIAESRGHDNEDNVQDRSESKREYIHVCSLGGNQVQPARPRGTKVKIAPLYNNTLTDTGKQDTYARTRVITWWNLLVAFVISF